ncbi:hypothetical protein F5Y19DRAFT_269694 [Xylariaceae sp. FL1651]|nr:hypothetical protein F5Y19DRAFT_269694 [Xylariaceae sp. FL1651]
MYRKMVQRKAVEDKETNFTLHGQPVDLRKINRFVKRVALSPSQLPTKATPTYILAFTPRSAHKHGSVTFPWSQSPHKHFIRIIKAAAAERTHNSDPLDFAAELSWLENPEIW